MFTDPIKNLKQFGLREDMVVVDLGAGTGFYSVIAAEMVPRGKVYAIEIIREYLATIKSKAKDLDLDNLECIWGNAEKIGGTKLADNVADAVLASNVFSQIENKEKFVLETSRILKKHGRVLIIDWFQSFSEKELPFNKSVPKEDVLKIFERHDFIFEKEIDAGITHYGIIFKNGKKL